MKTEINITWDYTDVIHYAYNSLDFDLSKEQACEILATIENNYDAEMGINWETIDHAIQDYLNEKGIEF